MFDLEKTINKLCLELVEEAYNPRLTKYDTNKTLYTRINEACHTIVYLHYVLDEYYSSLIEEEKSSDYIITGKEV